MSRQGFAALSGCLLLAAAAAPAEQLDCVIQPRTSVTVSSPIEGRVAAILVERGDVVEKGQQLAELESRRERANYEIAAARAKAVGRKKRGEAQLHFSVRELERQQSLEERDVVSAREMDEALQAKELAEAELVEIGEQMLIARLEHDRAAANLALRTIESPVSGVVVERLIDPGEYADPPQILEVAEIDPLYVEVFAPLRLINKIEVGTRARVRPEAPIGGEHSAEVTVVDRVVDGASGTFGVRLELPNPDHAIPAGLRCQVVFSGAGWAPDVAGNTTSPLIDEVDLPDPGSLSLPKAAE